jgi:tryptophan--tRNA ligase
MYYMNLVTVARVQRNPTVKNEIKMRGFEANLPVGFFTYPISQASDITAFMGTIVPVGEDQEPMIEQCREIVRKFNATYGEVLVEPEIYLPDNKACLRLPGTDGQAKMSKSLGNTIYLSDSEQELKTKVMSMYTDPNHIKVEDPGQVEGNTVFTYLDAFVQPDSFEKYLPEYKDLDELKDHYRRGGLGDVKVKKFLLKVLNEFLEPIRERRAYYEEHPEVVVEILRKGTELANSEAEKTLDKMKKAMQIDYFNQWNEDYNLK